ncbi:hypothetical protein KKA72_00435 [Patescibacteria group bacterium]|nr:hypothetical protein [Patescibacteria group bacterium]
MNKKVLFIVFIAILSIGSFYICQNFFNKPEQIFCTQEAKLCPDGSYVGRTGPNCEFAVCPEVKIGALKGKVTIGPLCPVERIPPDPNCQPTEATYKAWQIAVYTLYKKTKIAQIEPSLDGSYQVGLPEGNYLVDFEQEHVFGRSLSITVIIKKDEIKVLNIDIDTGIR